MKALPWILVAIFTALLGVGLWERFRPVPVVDLPTTRIVRDSVKAKRDTIRVHTTEYIQKIKWIPADTLGAILRALAARPVVRGSDTIPPEPSDTICRVTLTCSEARQLAIRDTVKEERQDSTRGDLRIQEARADSLAAHLSSCLEAKPRWGYVAAFEAGYLTGTVVTATICAVVR